MSERQALGRSPLRGMNPGRTPWTEAIEVRRRWHVEGRGLEQRPPGAVREWRLDLEGEVERFADDREADPREALVQLIAVAGACLDAMDRPDALGAGAT